VVARRKDPMQEQPPAVPDRIGATQAGEAHVHQARPPALAAKPGTTGGKVTVKAARRARWEWAQAPVWTDRMLAALEYGVKGGVWFSLIDKLYLRSNLWSAWAKSARNNGSPGVDGITIDRYEEDVEANLTRLAQRLRDGSYRPRAIRRTYIPKADGTMRPLGIPTVEDRIVQGALRHVVEPIFEKEFAQHSYGFRPGRGCKDALRRVDELLKNGHRYVVDADLKSYFDTIPHDRLMKRVRDRIADGRVLELLRCFLEAKVMEDLREYTPVAGAPQGAVLAPLLSNIYLNPLDHLMAGQGWEMIRYADDFVILCRTPEEAEAALEAVRAWTAQAGLTLHPTKTRIADTQTQAFEFLGYRFDKNHKYPRDKSRRKLRDTLRPRLKRNKGVSLQAIIGSINPSLRGWFAYFQHARRTSHRDADQWVRMRLRSILRRRAGKRGRGRGSDHQRWPNAFFAKQGLFSLEQAHAVACQSMKMAH
jgi:RNA-directed DNA polymerase